MVIPGTPNQPLSFTFFFGPKIFGKLALLDSAARGATVRADSEVRCHDLTLEGFQTIAREGPQTAIKLTKNLGRELAGRVRDSHVVNSDLEK